MQVLEKALTEPNDYTGLDELTKGTFVTDFGT